MAEERGAPVAAGPVGGSLVGWVPRRFVLAVDLMLDVAFNGAAGPVPAAELGERRGLDTRKLEAILQRLSRAGLLKSVRGPNGGYLLGDERAAISLGAIARAVQEGEGPAVDWQSAALGAVVMPAIGAAADQLLAALDGVSLSDLCQRSRAAGLRGKSDGVVDFVI